MRGYAGALGYSSDALGFGGEPHEIPSRGGRLATRLSWCVGALRSGRCWQLPRSWWGAGGNPLEVVFLRLRAASWLRRRPGRRGHTWPGAEFPPRRRRPTARRWTTPSTPRKIPLGLQMRTNPTSPLIQSLLRTVFSYDEEVLFAAGSGGWDGRVSGQPNARRRTASRI